jgi:hypothetical protein
MIQDRSFSSDRTRGGAALLFGFVARQPRALAGFVLFSRYELS